jgi:hypothetical protein
MVLGASMVAGRTLGTKIHVIARERQIGSIFGRSRGAGAGLPAAGRRTRAGRARRLVRKGGMGIPLCLDSKAAASKPTPPGTARGGRSGPGGGRRGTDIPPGSQTGRRTNRGLGIPVSGLWDAGPSGGRVIPSWGRIANARARPVIAGKSPVDKPGLLHDGGMSRFHVAVLGGRRKRQDLGNESAKPLGNSGVSTRTGLDIGGAACGMGFAGGGGTRGKLFAQLLLAVLGFAQGDLSTAEVRSRLLEVGLQLVQLLEQAAVVCLLAGKLRPPPSNRLLRSEQLHDGVRRPNERGLSRSQSGLKQSALLIDRPRAGEATRHVQPGFQLGDRCPPGRPLAILPGLGIGGRGGASSLGTGLDIGADSYLIHLHPRAGMVISATGQRALRAAAALGRGASTCPPGPATRRVVLGACCAVRNGHRSRRRGRTTAKGPERRRSCPGQVDGAVRVHRSSGASVVNPTGLDIRGCSTPGRGEPR